MIEVYTKLCLNCVVYLFMPENIPLPIFILILTGLDMMIVGGAINGDNNNR